MSVGLWDADFMTFRQPIFNLELMKLAAYYKQQREIVSMAPRLEPERYSKFFIRKDWDDGKYPVQFFDPNVVYGGRAFSSKYMPLKDEIEETIPDVHLYDRYANIFTGLNKGAFKAMQNATHVRASYDEINVAPDLAIQINASLKLSRTTLIFHDYNLSYQPHSLEVIRNIIREYKARSKETLFIGAKFPIQINNDQQLIEWLSFETSAKFYTLQINNIMNDESFNLLLQQSANKCNNFEYIITSTSSSEDDFIINKLPIIYKQLLISQNQGKRILLKYEDDFFMDKRWEKVIDYLNVFNGARAGNIQRKRSETPITLYKFVKNWSYFEKMNKTYGRQPYKIEEIREIFQLVREKNYDVFKMFYENTGEEFI